jgi:hypothetical protein
MFGEIEPGWKEILLLAIWVALFVLFLPFAYSQKWAWESAVLRALGAVTISAIGSTMLTAYAWAFLKS